MMNRNDCLQYLMELTAMIFTPDWCVTTDDVLICFFLIKSNSIILINKKFSYICEQMQDF
jgi:hypothetical protein